MRYRNTFRTDGTAPAQLVISDAHEGVEVFLNGRSQGLQIVPPFRYVLSEDLLNLNYKSSSITAMVATPPTNPPA